ncbi:NAD(P)-dependent dehydrogenase (short-subunit alcohol dehydrogenase family) [Pseudomonas sp. BP6]|nr:NAD(P)-dependent dehydrogenase (short-subunit alcohol dehydrogenase family) [Pseudomonas sp. BP6]MBP2290128.1 NAD(P)-dependent dehydrogenase (short-subunit alcohol dehydrogenase family) [Pseudomonas sp. BP7]
MQLRDKVAVVLGASAEAGTGWAIAQRFAGEGAKVIVPARREAPLIQLAQRIGGVAQICDLVWCFASNAHIFRPGSLGCTADAR